MKKWYSLPKKEELFSSDFDRSEIPRHWRHSNRQLRWPCDQEADIQKDATQNGNREGRTRWFVGGALKSGTAAAEGELREQQKRIALQVRGMWPSRANDLFLCDGTVATVSAWKKMPCWKVGREEAENWRNQEFQWKSDWTESGLSGRCLRSSNKPFIFYPLVAKVNRPSAIFDPAIRRPSSDRDINGSFDDQERLNFIWDKRGFSRLMSEISPARSGN
jgi:hypothetical protein